MQETLPAANTGCPNVRGGEVASISAEIDMLVKKRPTSTVVWKMVMHVLMKQAWRKPLLGLLALLMVMTAAQIGPLARSASAEPPERRKHCPYLGAEDPEELADGTVIIWVCTKFFNVHGLEYWDWQFSRIIYPPRDNRDRLTTASRESSSPPYRMAIQSAVSDGRGGGVAVGAIGIYNLDGTELNRRIAVHTIMEYAPSPTSGYLNCHDLGWVEAPSQRHFWSKSIVQYSEPDCGTGYYRAQVAGRFFATSTNAWETSSWHYSPALYMTAPSGANRKEPTTTPATGP
jgi:hypothetical protein